MIPKRLKRLDVLNNRLKASAWGNYQAFLEVLLRSVNHVEASHLLELLQKKDYTALVEHADLLASIEYRTPGEHLLLNQLSALIRKYPYPKGVVKFDPQGKAISVFKSAEHHARRTNQRFSLLLHGRDPYSLELSYARNWILNVLGHEPCLRDVWEECDFGPGAALGIHGNATNKGRKFLSQSWTVTPGAYYYAQAALIGDIHFHEYLNRESGTSPFFCVDPDLFHKGFRLKARVVDNNKIAFVPKTAKVHRTIAVEPLLNGFVQKGIDNVLRKRLKRVGIDLSDQTRNQELARKGSLPGELDPYVTIDLSSASDSIATEFVRYMLPPAWFDLLDQCRSRQYSMEGQTLPFHKFCTMGNGFCFPLETLLFASLCFSAYKKSHRGPDFSVYGDDIIVRQSVAPDVLHLLKVAGFKTNTRKTFLLGPFRESCGADWFEGKDVRPMSLDYAFDSFENVVKFVNLARRKDSWSVILHEACEFLTGLIPPDLCFCRPFMGNVDTALEVPLDVFLASPFSSWNRNLQTWSWTELAKSAKPDKGLDRIDGYDLALMRGVLTGSKSPVPFAVRRNTSTKIRRVAYCGALSTWSPRPSCVRDYMTDAEVFKWRTSISSTMRP